MIALQEAIITQDALEFEAVSRFQGRKNYGVIIMKQRAVHSYCSGTKNLFKHLFSCFMPLALTLSFAGWYGSLATVEMDCD